MIPICKVCGMPDTRVGSYDGAEGCGDCYSIEQGFLYVDDFDNELGLVVDEDGLIYKENEELNGAIACEWRRT